MKKITAGLGLVVTLGFTGLAASPAMAVPFVNCDAAAAAGVYNIPSTDSRYGTHLDSDGDGIGCENASFGVAVDPAPVAPVAPVVPVASGVFENCDAAAAVGVYNIPSTDPRYGTHLDSDLDGIGCENANFGIAPNPNQGIPVPPVTPVPPVAPTAGGQQVGQMPVGGADTGIPTTTNAGNDTGALALGGGLVLAAAAGGALLIRRRTATQA